MFGEIFKKIARRENGHFEENFQPSKSKTIGTYLDTNSLRGESRANIIPVS